MAIKNSWSSGEVLTAADLTDTMKGVYINAQTATTFTFGTADGFVTLSNASGGTATIPANSTAAFNTGAVIGVMNAGTAGSFTIGTAAGVTLNAVSGTTTLAPLESATLVKLGTNTWQLSKGGGAADSTQGLYLITTQSFSAAASVSVNNCFSATYDNYQIVIQALGTVAGTTGMNFRLRVGGVDLSSSVYYYGSTFVTAAAGPTREYGGAGTVHSIGNIGDYNYATSIDVFGAALAKQTVFTNLYNGPGTTAAYYGMVCGWANNTTAYDGFTIYPTSGGSTITGTLRVYGYRN